MGPDFPPGEAPPDRARWALVAAAVLALGGALFAGQSTGDFVQHLDRQVHSIHCSFLPGAAKELGESGCRTVMLSPYSSWFRESLWGGIPVSLFALAVFAYLAYRAGHLAWRGGARKRETLFLVAAFGLPVLMSLVYGWLSLAKVEATCKVCIGIYATSFGGLIAAIAAHQLALPDPEEGFEDEPGPSRNALWGVWFAQGVGYVAVLTIVYLALAPKPSLAKGGCGSLVTEGDPNGILIPLSAGAGGVAAVEVLDPLCPSCKSFERRLEASGLDAKLSRRGVLFPLDASCNWMVGDSLHPGACAVSEAILCVGPLSKDPTGAPAAVEKLLSWSFAHQEELREQAKADEAKLRERLEREFPAVKGCLGGSVVRNKLVKSLRWGVANAIPVLTPQLFVGKQRVCDEDTDLGLEYTVGRMLSSAAPAKGASR